MAGTALARRRRLSAGRFAVWRSLMEGTGELHRIVGAELPRDAGLSNADYRDLVALSEAPAGRMRSTQLAAAIEGADRFRRATTPHARAIKKYFADALTPQQLDAFDDILRTLREHLKS